MTIQIQRLKNDNDPSQRAYFSRTELTNKVEVAERGQLEGIENPILQCALEVPGVIIARVASYQLMLVKAPTYEWEEIEPTILRLLTAFNIPGGGRLEPYDEQEAKSLRTT